MTMSCSDSCLKKFMAISKLPFIRNHWCTSSDDFRHEQISLTHSVLHSFRSRCMCKKSQWENTAKCHWAHSLMFDDSFFKTNVLNHCTHDAVRFLVSCPEQKSFPHDVFSAVPDSVCASVILIQLWLFWIPAHACSCRSAALTTGLQHFNCTAVSASPLHLLSSAPSCSQINVSLSEAIREMFLKVQNRSSCSGHTPHEDNLSCSGCSQLSEFNTRPDGESIVFITLFLLQVRRKNVLFLIVVGCLMYDDLGQNSVNSLKKSHTTFTSD